MRIQHNISALNSHRNLAINQNNTSSNLEKLSSGYRINRAADDAAGLGISEKMRAQIRGLEMATSNAQDGVSLLQTGEGALQETQEILQRMRELAVQASNGVYEEGVDAEQIQKEVDALTEEIDRISDSTHFNNKKLLDGSATGVRMTDVTSTVSAATTNVTTLDAITGGDTFTTLNDTQTWALTWADADGTAHTVEATLTVAQEKTAGTTEKITVSFGDQTIELESSAVDTSVTADQIGTALATVLSNDTEFTNNFAIGGSNISGGTITSKATGSESATIVSVGFGTTNTAGNGLTQGVDETISGDISYEKLDFTNVTVATSGMLTEEIEDSIFEFGGQKFLFNDGTTDGLTAEQQLALSSDITIIDLAGASFAAATDGSTVAVALSKASGVDVSFSTAGNAIGLVANDVYLEDPTQLNGNGITFQIGANGTSDDRVSISISDQSSTALGVNTLDLTNTESANAAIELLDAAINSVSSTRADFGALQNRLEHAISNLGTSVENLTAAESRIRDVDMADEMMDMTKNNILTQAAQSMLAQANQLPQGVLQLLG